MIRLGVLGWPVAHSRSPALHNAALAAVGLGEQWRYQLLPVPPEHFEETVAALAASGFRGVNVTIPHKHAALALATSASGRARAIGAANTLLFESDGSIIADNTDAPALSAALAAIEPVAGQTVLVLGAGGSARAAVWALRAARANVAVWNRTGERARDLCESLGGTPVGDVQALGVIDMLVNCTAVGLRPDDTLAELPSLAQPEALSGYSVVVDFVYADTATPLLSAARSTGVRTVDGLELLVGQAAISFELFTGLPAPLDVMRAAVGLCSAR